LEEGLKEELFLLSVWLLLFVGDCDGWNEGEIRGEQLIFIVGDGLQIHTMPP